MKLTRISHVTGIATTYEKDESGRIVSVTHKAAINVRRARTVIEKPDDVTPERWRAMQKWLSLNPPVPQESPVE